MENNTSDSPMSYRDVCYIIGDLIIQAHQQKQSIELKYAKRIESLEKENQSLRNDLMLLAKEQGYGPSEEGVPPVQN